MREFTAGKAHLLVITVDARVREHDTGHYMSNRIPSQPHPNSRILPMHFSWLPTPNS
jgi:hypothetical protein